MTLRFQIYILSLTGLSLALGLFLRCSLTLSDILYRNVAQSTPLDSGTLGRIVGLQYELLLFFGRGTGIAFFSILYSKYKIIKIVVPFDIKLVYYY